MPVFVKCNWETWSHRHIYWCDLLISKNLRCHGWWDTSFFSASLRKKKLNFASSPEHIISFKANPDCRQIKVWTKMCTLEWRHDYSLWINNIHGCWLLKLWKGLTRLILIGPSSVFRRLHPSSWGLFSLCFKLYADRSSDPPTLYVNVRGRIIQSISVTSGIPPPTSPSKVKPQSLLGIFFVGFLGETPTSSCPY